MSCRVVIARNILGRFSGIALGRGSALHVIAGISQQRWPMTSGRPAMIGPLRPLYFLSPLTATVPTGSGKGLPRSLQCGGSKLGSPSRPQIPSHMRQNDYRCETVRSVTRPACERSTQCHNHSSCTPHHCVTPECRTCSQQPRHPQAPSSVYPRLCQSPLDTLCFGYITAVFSPSRHVLGLRADRDHLLTGCRVRDPQPSPVRECHEETLVWTFPVVFVG
ncbi:hypothetical protein J6590_075181 [Homalodisca vitripennis]|nr:hypothetical protein J6590_075181 [Homalodisca vitripennis]